MRAADTRWRIAARPIAAIGAPLASCSATPTARTPTATFSSDNAKPFFRASRALLTTASADVNGYAANFGRSTSTMRADSSGGNAPRIASPPAPMPSGRREPTSAVSARIG